MALLSVTSVYVLVFVWLSWCYLRRRDPVLRDAMWMFASVAMLFVVGVIRALAGAPSRIVMAAAIALLLAKPLFTVRLVARLRPMPSWGLPAAVVAWLASTLPVLVSASGPVPRAAVWPAVAVFFTMELLAAWLLRAEGRRRGGGARARLWCAAAGTGLFGAALVVSALGRAAAVEARALAVLAGVLYLAAFVPPAWLRRLWANAAQLSV